jgi:hypothetical protein
VRKTFFAETVSMNMVMTGMLVANRLKHGCMTLPGSDAPAPGLGLVSPEPSMMMDHAQMQHATSAVDTAPPKSDHA